MNKKTTKKKSSLSPSGKKLQTRNKPQTKSSGEKTRSTKKASTAKYPVKEIRLIILMFLTIVLFLSYYFNSFGPVGRLLKNLGGVLFGAIAYLVPVYLLSVTIHLFLKGTLTPYVHRYVFSGIGALCISGMQTLAYVHNYPHLFEGSNMLFSSLLETVVQSGIAHNSGGVLGAVMALPLRALVAAAGTWVILIFLLIVCVVVSIGIDPIRAFVKYAAASISNYIKAVKGDEEASGDDEIKITGADEPKPPKKKKKKETSEETPSGDDEFKINVFDKDKKDDDKEYTSAEIPDDIKKMAMEESGGVEETKEDNTPIAVTDDEIENDYIEYTFPPMDLLEKAKSTGGQDRSDDLRTQAKKLVDTLASFGVEAKVLEVSKGPSVTRFELQPSAGVKVSKIVNLADDIALNLAAFGVRIEAPIPGKAAVGIEIPNKTTTMVCLRDVIDSQEFRNFKSKTAFAMGKDISGQPVISDISKMPHMLIAGATGSGKSVCINSLITSILYKADPNHVKLILIDPKVVELGVYNGIPHLLIPVVTDPRRAAGALNWAVQEMVKRYSMFATANVRDIKGYNEYASLNGERELEQIIIVIDELADLMMVSPHEVEDSICRLAQMARAAGMHLVIATQRPSVDVITGLIKANVPSRIAFSVSSQIDSRTILDMGGAEKLLGKGDMLFLPMGASKPQRLQGAFVSDKEIERIVEFIKADSTAHYNEDIIEHIENGAEDRGGNDDSEADDLLPQAIEVVVELGQASASLLQRKLKVGYSRAGRLIDQLEERGIIGPHEGSKPRKVLMSRNEFQEMMVNNIED